MRLGFAGSKTTTYECMRQLIADGFKIDLLVTLTPEQNKRHGVAGYMDLSAFARKGGIPVYNPKSYTLKDPNDREHLLGENIDCLLVIGWQRLIPDWWLKALDIGAFGMHGSPEPLPRGRGRSPLNWSLLTGKTSFLTHLFRYDAGIDSGEIVGVQKFEINHWDDCDSLHMKNRIAMNRLLGKYLPSILAGKAQYVEQPRDIEPTYFPKRTPEDGKIAWANMDMTGLFNHIRCQTRPFPGAFTYLPASAEKFYLWRGVPFDGYLSYPNTRPGMVEEIFYDSSFLVAVWDGSVRITDYTSPEERPPDRGVCFLDGPPVL